MICQVILAEKRGVSYGGQQIEITPKPLRGEDGYKVFSIRIKTSIAQDLYTLAEKTGRSRNELIGMILEYGLAHYEIEEEK